MSKYTTELRFICENYAGLVESKGYDNIANIISNSREKIFDFSYPIFDETYRSVLETKIIKHFYTREICCETVGQWKHFLDMRMNEIMPYFNKLYESELIEFNPLYDIDLTTDHNKKNNGLRDEHGTNTGTIENSGSKNSTFGISKSVSGTSSTDETISDDIDETYGINEADVKKNLHWDVYSDTPQGALTNVANETYLTNARKITDDGTGSSKTGTNTKRGDNDREIDSDTTTSETTTGTNTESTTTTNTETRNLADTNVLNIADIEDYIEHVKGKSGGVSYSKLLNEFRDTFLNIDVMIIERLNDLFFNLW